MVVSMFMADNWPLIMQKYIFCVIHMDIWHEYLFWLWVGHVFWCVSSPTSTLIFCSFLHSKMLPVTPDEAAIL